MRIPLALALAAGLAACQRPQPSPDYEKARQLHAALVARSPLDPYAQPEMAQVMELLSRVPADSLDAEAAGALREKVDAELRAQAEERTRRARLVEGAGAPVGWTGGSGASPGGESASPPEAPVAGAPSDPEAAARAAERPPSSLAEGTALEEFQRTRSDCFEAKAPARINRTDGKSVAGQAWGLKDSDACRKAHPAEVGRLVLFAEGKLLEVREAGDAREEKVERKVQGELRPDGTIALPKGEVLPPGAKARWEGPTPPRAPGAAPAPGTPGAAPAPAPAPAR